jgi:hypothetical protein
LPAEDRRRGDRRRQPDRRKEVPAAAAGPFFLSCPKCNHLRHFWGYRKSAGPRQRAILRYHAHYRRWHVQRPD